jgi:cold shock CspA family protein/ribosome-associated translation inhibitor RaiA
MRRTIVQRELQITARDVVLAPAEEQAIRDAAAHMETFWDRITSCRVLVEVPSRRGRTGRLYNVRIDLGLPGGEVVIRRQPREALLTAVQEAFKAAERRVQDAARRVRGDVKLDRSAPRGVVTRLFPGEGYGFITDDNGRELYFDRESVLAGAFGRLEEGMDVRFAEELGEKGPQASTVSVTRRRRGRTREVTP